MGKDRKNDVLKRLMEADGAFVSGEELCGDAGISREAIWKIIQKLKEEGYDITAVRNRGYRLNGRPDLLTEQLCRFYFHGKDLCSKIECYDEIGSTNERAKQAADEQAPHGTLIVADRQTAGKGRRGRSWVSPPGTGIAMSLLLRPDIAPESAPALTLVMALAASEAIKSLTGLTAMIKWPNDLVADGRKVAGILTEMSAETDQIHYVVIGVGINVSVRNFPEEIKETATSILLQTGKTVSRAELIARTMEIFEEKYAVFVRDRNLKHLREAYEEKLINKGRSVTVLSPSGNFSGKARGIDADGQLLVEKEDGSVVSVRSGEVSVRGVYGYV